MFLLTIKISTSLPVSRSDTSFIAGVKSDFNVSPNFSLDAISDVKLNKIASIREIIRYPDHVTIIVRMENLEKETKLICHDINRNSLFDFTIYELIPFVHHESKYEFTVTYDER